MPRGLKKFLKALGSIFDGLAFLGFIVDLGRLVVTSVMFIFSFFP